MSKKTMIPKVRRGIGAGFTLIEVMVAVAVTIIVALGTLSYQYYGVKHDRMATAQLAATRIGQLVLEDWKSTGGDPDYDPTTLGLGFTATGPGETGNCFIILDDQTFYIQLVQSNPPAPFHDDVAGITLSQIRVITKWRQDYARGPLVASDHTITLTTYVRRDGN
ncbi:MAG: prepilin-type N-terminal cleavage/methylation domain-containing protein [Sedimentisphaerales bacterium]